MQLEARERLADQLWLAVACDQGGQHWVGNAPCQMTAVNIGQHAVPLSQPRSQSLTLQRNLPPNQPDSSYVASLPTAWVRYPQQEARRHLPPLARPWLAPAAAVLNEVLRLAALDKASFVGNYLISTHLPPAWSVSDLPAAWPALLQASPNAPLVMRSICPALQGELASTLQAMGCSNIVARQIYLCDPRDPTLWKHNHVRKDQRLLDDPAVDVLKPAEIKYQDLPRLRALFRQLFIDKHSQLNPDFTPDFFEFCLDTGFLDLYALRYQGELVGVLGLYARNGWLTTPLIGYDTSLPQSLGLYRRLMALLYRQARERRLQLHLSSGADAFKRARGGQGHLEYTAVYARHLPRFRQLALAAFARSMNHLAPRALARL